MAFGGVADRSGIPRDKAECITQMKSRLDSLIDIAMKPYCIALENYYKRTLLQAVDMAFEQYRVHARGEIEQQAGRPSALGSIALSSRLPGPDEVRERLTRLQQSATQHDAALSLTDSERNALGDAILAMADKQRAGEKTLFASHYNFDRMLVELFLKKLIEARLNWNTITSAYPEYVDRLGRFQVSLMSLCMSEPFAGRGIFYDKSVRGILGAVQAMNANVANLLSQVSEFYAALAREIDPMIEAEVNRALPEPHTPEMLAAVKSKVIRDVVDPVVARVARIADANKREVEGLPLSSEFRVQFNPGAISEPAASARSGGAAEASAGGSAEASSVRAAEVATPRPPLDVGGVPVSEPGSVVLGSSILSPGNILRSLQSVQSLRVELAEFRMEDMGGARPTTPRPGESLLLLGLQSVALTPVAPADSATLTK